MSHLKIFQILTFVVLALGLIATNIISGYSSGRGMLYILSPYLVMGIIAAWINYKKSDAAANISLFIAACSICVLKVTQYCQAVFHPGSSTAGLIFLVMPLFSIPIFLVIYLISKIIISVKLNKHEESLTGKKTITVGLGLLAALVFYAVYLAVKSVNFKRDEFSWEQTDNTNGNIVTAKRIGVYVKDLQYKVDSTSEPVNFSPFIEKVFQYGNRENEIKVFEDTEFPYAVAYQTEPIKGAIVLISKGHLSNVRNRRYVLREPKLKDTIFLEMKRAGVVVGRIKVWE